MGLSSRAQPWQLVPGMRLFGAFAIAVDFALFRVELTTVRVHFTQKKHCLVVGYFVVNNRCLKEPDDSLIHSVSQKPHF